MSKKDEKLIIYEKLINLIYYSKNLLNKFPKSERFDLCTDIKKIQYTSLKNIIAAWKETEDLKLKLKLLKKTDVDLVVLKTMIGVAHHYKYITDKNFLVWSEKITEIGKLLGGWIKICQKE